MEIDVRTTRGSSRLDRTRNYDVIKDLDDIKSNITFVQLIKESKRIEKELRDVMKRPTLKELKNFQEKNRKFKNKSQEIDVIIDTGVSTNIITKTLLDKLNIKIEESSNKIFTSANGKDIIALGKVKLNFEIQEKKLKSLKIPLKVDLIL